MVCSGIQIDSDKIVTYWVHCRIKLTNQSVRQIQEPLPPRKISAVVLQCKSVNNFLLFQVHFSINFQSKVKTQPGKKWDISFTIQRLGFMYLVTPWKRSQQKSINKKPSLRVTKPWGFWFMVLFPQYTKCWCGPL